MCAAATEGRVRMRERESGRSWNRIIMMREKLIIVFRFTSSRLHDDVRLLFVMNEER